MRYRQFIRQQHGGGKGADLNEWFEICAHCEILLREPPLNINCDTTISLILSLLCGVDIVDLTLHTMREDGNKQFFPPLRATKRAFYPLKISDEEASFLLQEHGWGTIGEMLACYLTSPVTIKGLQDKFNECVCPNVLDQRQIADLDQIFKQMLKYGA
jgi:hypothetical protein